MNNNPVVTLQENASGFFDKISEKHSDKMQCKKGCSKCCQTDISVFEIESDRIEDWFAAQEPVEQQRLLDLWQTPNQETYCTFLYNDQCTIYEARPLICRTQGLPLYVASENVLDYCPLNFKAGDPPKEDWLNLERMNTLLSFAASTEKKDKRIRLKKLKTKLLTTLK
ncbi:YkgJ family cysteine cluster protein [Bacteriovorax sp. PP10]|uniref:YkgJ family cysteine cluster protein n=1 Tax=Bacteriovorax antarcticus TaxID=3088717 RepID=A0ABU5VRP7_9BACT|nr:YkgJ family cysteine cluster protein [Bacteriovorax sp. PP10]MEA9355681.1 YkgJ family cysteine cluster protein [Bacteriovorax sp. PP10]